MWEIVINRLTKTRSFISIENTVIKLISKMIQPPSKQQRSMNWSIVGIVLVVPFALAQFERKNQNKK